MDVSTKWITATGVVTALGFGAACTRGETDGSAGAAGTTNGSGTSTGSLEATSCSAPTPVFNAVDPITGDTCHPSACTIGFCARADVASLGRVAQTQRLQDRLATLDCSPHTVSPVQIFAEAESASQLFAYYLLDSTTFQPSVFTTFIPGLNDLVQRTSFGANCDLSTIGAVRLALEPKPGLPTDPDDPRAFIDIFTDLRSLFVINNESGWYEGWMIHDLRVADVREPCDAAGHAQFGKITKEDANLLAAMGPNNVAGNLFTIDGQAPHLPSPTDHFPDRVTNVVSLYLSMGAYNALQQSDAHNYWEFNYTTNWVHPLYELPYTGGLFGSYLAGLISFRQSIVPGSSPGDDNRTPALAVAFGDNPDLPRDPDKFEGQPRDESQAAAADAQREFRQRFVPSGIAREAYLNAYERLASFEPGVRDPAQRLLDGYKAAVALIDTNGDGIISALEGDIDAASTVCPQGDLTCIYLTPRSFQRFAVTREINDGLLAPRFAPSTRAFVLAGTQVTGFPLFGVSAGRDTDDR